MINKILSLLLNLILSVIQAILNIILLPLTLVIQSLFPDLSGYIGSFNTLLNTYLFPGLRFAREVVFNITGINRNLVGIMAIIPLTYLTFTLANMSVRFLVSIYRIYKTGKDE